MRDNKFPLLVLQLTIFALVLMSTSTPAEPEPEPPAISESSPSPSVQVGYKFEPVAFCEEFETEPIPETEPERYYDVPLDEEIQDHIRSTLDEFELDVSNGFEIVLGIAYTESRFHADSENGSCKGIMQVSTIHQSTLDKLGIRDLFDPFECFRAGIYFLKSGFDNADLLWEEIEGCELSKEEFCLNCALMSYNLGNYGAEKKVRSGVYSTSYVEKVRKAMANLEVKNE